MEKPQPRRLESVAEVADVLRPVLEDVRNCCLSSGKDDFVSWRLTSRELRKIKGRKGLIARGLDGLLNLKDNDIPGLTRQQAVEAALSSLLGERQNIPTDAVERNMYMVRVVFAAGIMPTLTFGKVDKTGEAATILLPMVQEVLTEPSKPVLTEDTCIMITIPRQEQFNAKAYLGRYVEEYGGIVDDVSPNESTVLVHAGKIGVEKQQARLRLDVQEEARAAFEKLKKWETDAASGLNTFVIWDMGVSDMDYLSGACGIGIPNVEARFHLIEVPRPVSPEVGNITEAIQAQMLSAGEEGHAANV